MLATAAAVSYALIERESIKSVAVSSSLLTQRITKVGLLTHSALFNFHPDFHSVARINFFDFETSIPFFFFAYVQNERQ